MIQKDLVSVILPVYNGEATLKEAVDSVLNQTYKNVEIVMVNDGSVDSSLSIIEKYAEKHNNVKVVSKPNGGLASARNAGIANASGEYICFCDADDMYKPNFIELMHKAITEDDVDVVTCKTIRLKKDKLLPRSLRKPVGIYTKQELLHEAVDDGTLRGILISGNCTRIYKHSIIRDNNITFDETVMTNQDGVFNLAYLFHMDKIKFIDEALYIVRDSPFKGKKRFKEADIFGPTNAGIRKVAEGKIDNFEEQMLARRVSVAIWSMLIYSQKYKLFFAYKSIKKIVLDDTLKEGFKYIKVDKLDRKKRILFKLLQKKRYNLLYLIFIINRFVTLH